MNEVCDICGEVLVDGKHRNSSRYKNAVCEHASSMGRRIEALEAKLATKPAAEPPPFDDLEPWREILNGVGSTLYGLDFMCTTICHEKAARYLAEKCVLRSEYGALKREWLEQIDVLTKSLQRNVTLEVELARLRDALPKTADGVAIVPRGGYWHRGDGRGRPIAVGVLSIRDPDSRHQDDYPVGERWRLYVRRDRDGVKFHTTEGLLYSTEAAALAAKEVKA